MQQGWQAFSRLEDGMKLHFLPSPTSQDSHGQCQVEDLHITAALPAAVPHHPQGTKCHPAHVALGSDARAWSCGSMCLLFPDHTWPQGFAKIGRAHV